MFVLLALLAASGPQNTNLGHGRELMQPPATPFELAADSVAIPLRLDKGHIYVDVTLDGRGPYPFLFDTGAHGNVMDLQFAREQGLALGQEITVGSPTGGGRPGHLVTIGQVALGGLTLRNVMLVAFDGLPFERSETSPRGVLSPYGLPGLLVSVDYPGARIVFQKGALPEPDGREVFGWDRSRGLPELPATVAGTEILVQLDTGASGGLSLPVAMSKTLPVEGPLVDMGYAGMVDLIRPIVGARLAGAFTIGRYTVDRPTVGFVDITNGVGNVGSEILEQFVITVDPANSRLRLAGPADGVLHVTEERKPHFGIHLDSIEAESPRVRAVDSGSPAEKAGLREGDHIERMNGQAMEALPALARAAALRESPLKLTVKRGTERLEVELAFE